MGLAFLAMLATRSFPPPGLLTMGLLEYKDAKSIATPAAPTVSDLHLMRSNRAAEVGDPLGYHGTECRDGTSTIDQTVGTA